MRMRRTVVTKVQSTSPFDWSDGHNYTPKVYDFDLSNCGVGDTSKLTADSSLLDYVQLFFDAALMNLIVTEANKYFDYITQYFCFSQLTNVSTTIIFHTF